MVPLRQGLWGNDILDRLIAELQILFQSHRVLNFKPDDRGRTDKRAGKESPLRSTG